MGALNFKTREEAHGASRSQMRTGRFQEAVEGLLSSHIRFGPHILQMVDIASCYYMLQDYLNYRNWTLKSQQEFNKVSMQLCEDSRNSAALAIGKLLEELGQIVPALEVYKEIEGYLSPSRFTLKVKAQVLRLYCVLGDRSRVSTAYMDLSMATKEDLSCQFDYEHALLHADILLHGFDVAFKRAQRILVNNDVPQFEKNLIYFDFLFEVLKMKSLKPEWLQPLHGFSYDNCDAFEKTVWDLCLVEVGQKPILSTDHFRAEGLSPLCSLRILLLIQSRDEFQEEAQLAKRKFLLLSQQMDPRSRRILRKTWGLEEETTELEWTGQLLKSNSEVLDLSQQLLAQHVLSLFTEQAEIPTDSLIEQLFRLPHDLSSYGRLKTLISRLNRALEGVTGKAASFSVSKKSVKLGSGLVLRKAE